MNRNLFFAITLPVVVLSIVIIVVLTNPGKAVSVAAAAETSTTAATAAEDTSILSPIEVPTGVSYTPNANQKQLIIKFLETERACKGTRESCGLPPIYLYHPDEGVLNPTLSPRQVQAAANTQAVLPTLPPPLQTALAANPRPETVRIMGRDWPLPPDLYYGGGGQYDCGIAPGRKCLNIGFEIHSHSNPDIVLYIDPATGNYTYGGPGNRHTFDSFTRYLNELWE